MVSLPLPSRLPDHFPDHFPDRLPYAFAREWGVCLDGSQTPPLLVWKAPLRLCALLEARRFAGCALAARAVEEAEFERRIEKVYAQGAGDARRFAEDAGAAYSTTASLAQAAREATDLLAQEGDAPVIRLTDALLCEALADRASDIHLESGPQALTVRLRIDGVLQDSHRLNPALAPPLVSRIKVMAKLDIAEKRLPQDGRFSLTLGGQEADVRVSTLPVGLERERVVLRLLEKEAGSRDLRHLGFSETAIASVEGLIARPHGIFLMTGPTGSGKTTSLYAMLARLHDGTRNILTVEDPIEYHLEGIGQMQVNARIEMSFARGLRAILRQDPDVIMLGEIRDAETAKIAVQASLTGHLVLSTLHTNSAVGAVTRLIEMGVEPYLLASSLIGLAAQRLVRRLCEDCKRPVPATPSESRFLGLERGEPVTLYQPQGCPACQGRGWRGRAGALEVIALDDGMRALIGSGAGERALAERAAKRAPTLLEDAKAKVLAGFTTCAEVIRACGEGG
jgi:general secretion pathway protein E